MQPAAAARGSQTAAVLLSLLLSVAMVAPVAAERGTRAVQGFGLVERYVCMYGWDGWVDGRVDD